tara:strand:+ start:7415 stop:7660 length:246 start_codon:yes stop_codon:yes gene_type:complete
MLFTNIKKAKKEFVWTDELALEFAKTTTLGPYGDYRGCKTASSKLRMFKKIKTDQSIYHCRYCQCRYIHDEDCVMIGTEKA